MKRGLLQKMANTVDRATYLKAAIELKQKIFDEISRKYPKVSGEPMGFWIDVDVEIGGQGSATPGVIGIRLDNNFGVVSWDEAEQWSSALHEAVLIAEDFPYLGYKVED